MGVIENGNDIFFVLHGGLLLKVLVNGGLVGVGLGKVEGGGFRRIARNSEDNI